MKVTKTYNGYHPPETYETDLKVGSKVTILYYSDRDPATIIKMSKNGNKITVRENEAIHIGEAYENKWEITDVLVGPELVFYRHKDGDWYSKNGGTCLNVFGHNKYYDYEF